MTGEMFVHRFNTRFPQPLSKGRGVGGGNHRVAGEGTITNSTVGAAAVNVQHRSEIHGDTAFPQLCTQVTRHTCHLFRFHSGGHLTWRGHRPEQGGLALHSATFRIDGHRKRRPISARSAAILRSWEVSSAGSVHDPMKMPPAPFFRAVRASS